MATFSERIGKKEIKSIIQIDNIDQDLKNALWNGLTIYYWNLITDDWLDNNYAEANYLVTRIWIHYFKKRLDQKPNRKAWFIDYVEKFFFKAIWYEVYDFIEFVKNNYAIDSLNSTKEKFVSYCNDVLEQELSGYRFIDGILTPITSKEEIESIENALNVDDNYKTVKTHLSRALQLLSEKVNPDYRNSIKESVSAVESFCCILTGDPKASLGQALKIIEKKHSLHSALKNSFTNLYGYTSDADGIRHALLNEDNLKQEDAIFMLVSCSSFINYLIKKSR